MSPAAQSDYRQNTEKMAAKSYFGVVTIRKTCTKCGGYKPMAGGTNKGRGRFREFVCADCVDKSHG